MPFSQKIALALSAWTVLCFIAVGYQNLEPLGALILIGLLATKELSSSYMRPVTAERMNILIYIGLIFFAAVIARRVLEVVGVI